MDIEIIKKRIENLKTETKAMRDDPLLQEDYSKKILELIKLRRGLIRWKKLFGNADGIMSFIKK